MMLINKGIYRMKRLYTWFVACCLLFVLPIYAQVRQEQAEIVVMMDTSGTILPYYDDINKRVLTEINSKFIREGDMFHLISFSAKPRHEISQKITDASDLSKIVSRFMLLYQLGQNSDLLAAFDYAKDFTQNLKTGNKEKILVIISDGIFNPPKNSPYASYTPEQLKNKISRIASDIRGENWKVYFVKLPFPDNVIIRNIDGDVISDIAGTAGGVSGNAGSTGSGTASSGSGNAGSTGSGTTSGGSGNAGSTGSGTTSSGSGNAGSTGSGTTSSSSGNAGSATSGTTSGGSGNAGSATSGGSGATGSSGHGTGSTGNGGGASGSTSVGNVGTGSGTGGTNGAPVGGTGSGSSGASGATSGNTSGQTGSENASNERSKTDTTGWSATSNENAANAGGAGSSGNGTGASGTDGYTDISGNVTGSLGVTPSGLSNNPNEGLTLNDDNLKLPRVKFPSALEAVGTDLPLSLQISNVSDEVVELNLESVSLSNGLQSATVPVTNGTVKIQSGETADIAARLRLPKEAFPKGNYDTELRLNFADNKSVLPQVATLPLSVKPTWFEDFYDSGKFRIALIIFAILLLFLLLSLFLFLRGRALSSMSRAIGNSTGHESLNAFGAASSGTQQETQRASNDYAKQLEEQRRAEARERSALLNKSSGDYSPHSQYTEQRIRVNRNLSGMTEIYVFNQNRSIGKRNIHVMKPGSQLSVGGGKGDDFIIFLVKFPAHLASVRYDGADYHLTIHKSKYFPYVKGTSVNNCIGKTITLVSDKGYHVGFTFREYEEPISKLNTILTSIDYS